MLYIIHILYKCAMIPSRLKMWSRYISGVERVFQHSIAFIAYANIGG